MLSFNSYGKDELDFSSDNFCDQSPKVQVRKGLFYLPNQDKPFTGENLCIYSLNGQYQSKGMIAKGLKEGTWNYWHENGDKKPDIYYVNGEKTKKKFNDMAISKVYDNGQAEWTRSWKNDKEDGKWSEWYENGQLKLEGTYIEGKKVGKWSEWYENGQLFRERNYKNGNLDGKVIAWSEDGQVFFESNHIDGKAHGLTTDFKNGVIWFESEYKNGQKVKYTHFKNGQKQYETNYENEKKNGQEKSWNDFNQVESLKDFRYGVKISETSFLYYPNGQLEKEMNYRGDGFTKDGKQSYWYEDGQIQREHNYKNGRQQDTTAWNEIGQKTSLSYYLNNRLSKQIRFKYYENNQVKEEAHLDMSNINPVYIYLLRWHENGQKSLEVNYKDGKKNGKWIQWHDNGQQQLEKNYEKGELIGQEIWWDEGGQLDNG
jgi:antitoxin component YwqK of YwqJK toxin-antitoxin module